MAKNTAAVDRLIGRTFGRRYELVAHIARGGMATVYRGHDRQLDRVVAVKVPRPEFASDRRFSAQFRREARAAARLGHPNVVAVYDSGEERRLPYIVMEYVNGRTLRQILDAAERLDPQTTAEVIGNVAAALDHAHQAGVVHLDVKPENVLLTAESVKVADFGLVRAVQGRAEHAPAGTIQYVAPEVLRGDRVDAAADVYALGVVAYECLTGRPPFDGSDRDRIAEAHLNDRVHPPSRMVPSIPPAVDHAVLLATDPDPARRYRRAGDFAEALGAPRRRLTEAALNGSAPVQAPTDGHRRSQVPADGHHQAAGDLTAGYREVDADAPTLNHEVVPPPPKVTVRRSTAGPVSAREGGPRVRRRWPKAVRLLVVLMVVLMVLAGALGWTFLNPSPTTVPDVVGLNRQVAQARLLASGLRTQIGAPVPDREVPAGMVAQQIPPAGEESRRRAAVELRLSSGVPMANLPDLVGEDEEAALAALEQRQVQGRVQRVPHDDAEAGTVLRTVPETPAQVEQGSTVTLVVSEGPPTVEVPEVRGNPFLLAQTRIASAGLQAGREEVFDDEIAEGLVVGTDPEAGEEVETGSEVDILVSRGPERVEVPDLTGLSQEEAEQQLEDLGLKAETPFRFGFGDEVTGQEPAAGEQVLPGSEVFLRFDFF